MKVVKYLFLFVFAVSISLAVNAQQPNTPNTNTTQGGQGTTPPTPTPPETVDVYKRENIIPTKKPIPYSYVREADMMWAKDIWRFIDLRQRMNYPLRYPEAEPIGRRYSLYMLIMEGIKSMEITPFAYSQNWNNPFSEPTSITDISGTSKIAADTVWNTDNTVNKVDLRGNTVKGFYVKEKWYFDKQHSEMRVRITALAPLIIRQKMENGQPLPGVDRIIPFFVYFPQCRNLFASHPVYNPNNDAQNISFDDMFTQRRFASTIFQESNDFGNRFIVDYLSGQDALMEAERIKNDLFLMEHDFWEY
jgi:gliding motility associated protien GldN